MHGESHQRFAADSKFHVVSGSSQRPDCPKTRHPQNFLGTGVVSPSVKCTLWTKWSLLAISVLLLTRVTLHTVRETGYQVLHKGFPGKPSKITDSLHTLIYSPLEIPDPGKRGSEGILPRRNISDTSSTQIQKPGNLELSALNHFK